MACRLFGAKPYQNQCWVIDNWTLRNKLQWNFYQNTTFFIHGNASENIVYEMAAILGEMSSGCFTGADVIPIVFMVASHPGVSDVSLKDIGKSASQGRYAWYLGCTAYRNLNLLVYMYIDPHYTSIVPADVQAPSDVRPPRSLLIMWFNFNLSMDE